MITPETILEKWLTAFREGDVETLANMYDENAILIPTFSNRLLNTPAKIKDYFIKLSSREELHVDLHEKTLVTHKVAENIYSLCGIYCFRFSVEGEPLSFEARFSFIFDLKSQSPILQHHSSQIPRMI